MQQNSKKFEPTIESTVNYERQLWQARFSPCGDFLIGCSYDAMVARWKMDDGKANPISPLSGHNAWVQCMGFSKSQKRLLTADSWGKLICWDYQQEDAKTEWNHDQAHDGWIRDLAISDDGQRVATVGNDKLLKVWSVVNGKLQFELPHESTLFSVCFHPDGKSLVTGDLKGAINHWNLESKNRIRQIETKILYQHHKIQHCGGARRLAFDEKGKLLACAGQKEPQGGFAKGKPCVLVYDFESAKMIREMQIGGNSDGFVYDAQFHPDGFLMATSCAFPGKGHLWFWNPEDEKAVYISKKFPNGRCLDLHPRTGQLAMLISDSPNRNGRELKDDQYVGGSSKIHLLKLKSSAAQ